MGVKQLDSREEYVTLAALSQRYGIPVPTMYDWSYRPDKYHIPDGMIKKFGTRTKVNLVIFENWFHHRTK